MDMETLINNPIRKRVSSCDPGGKKEEKISSLSV